MDQDLYTRLRKRMLMFYFAAGINIVMALWVASVGAGQVPGSTLAMVLLIFIVFAAVNFYMARVLRRQWDQHIQQQQQRPGGGDAVTRGESDAVTK